MTLGLGSGERPAEPDADDVLHAWFEAYLHSIHTSFPARVERYDPAAQVADLQPLVQHAVPQPDGSRLYERLPVLPAVPVCFPRMGDWFVVLPVAVGDFVLVHCCESATGHWRAGDGSIQFPGDLRRFDLSHAVAVPGFVPAAQALAQNQIAGDLGTDLVLGRRDGTRIAVRADGQVFVTQGGSTVLRIDAAGVVNLGADTGASFVALASKVDSLIAAITGVTIVPGDGGAAIKAAVVAWVAANGTVAATKVKAT